MIQNYRKRKVGCLGLTSRLRLGLRVGIQSNLKLHQVHGFEKSTMRRCSHTLRAYVWLYVSLFLIQSHYDILSEPEPAERGHY